MLYLLEEERGCSTTDERIDRIDGIFNSTSLHFLTCRVKWAAVRR